MALSREYLPPECDVGDSEHDIVRGPCVVTKLQNGWPWGKPPRDRSVSPIIGHELADAIRQERIADVAEMLGIAVMTASRLRKRIGSGGQQVGQWQPSEEEIALLGTAPDEQIAKALGQSAHNVENHRRVRGIAAYSGPRGPITCGICGGQFYRDDWRIIYCSPDCSENANRQASRRSNTRWRIRKDQQRLRRQTSSRRKST